MATVGDVATRTRAVLASDIARFTEISGDRNPLHYDEALAARSRFGRIIVQGGVTSGLLNAVVAEDLPGPGSVFLHVDWSFKAPVGPGDEITARVEILRARADKPIYTLATTITNQDGVVVLDGTALVWQEPLAGPGPAPYGEGPTRIAEAATSENSGNLTLVDTANRPRRCLSGGES
jgi:acyl dehydratase